MAIRNVCYAILYVCHLPIRKHTCGGCINLEEGIVFGFHSCYHIFIDIRMLQGYKGWNVKQSYFRIPKKSNHTGYCQTLNIDNSEWLSEYNSHILNGCMGKLQCSSEYRCNAQQTYLQIYNFELMKMLVIRYSMRMRHETRAKIISMKKKKR